MGTPVSAAETGSDAGDYLAADLRARVENLKVDVAAAGTSAATAPQRAQTTWEWINAYSLTGGYVPVNSTLAVAQILAYQPSPAANANLDSTIRELSIVADDPDAIGTLSATTGPFEAASFAEIEQTYEVGAKAIGPGGGIIVARHFMTRFALFQTDDPSGDNYVSIASSNPGVQFARSMFPMSGMHGGFRSAIPTLKFEVAAGQLEPGDRVTVTYGDRAGGGRGIRVPTFSSDRMPLPLYIQFDDGETPISLPIQPIGVTGTTLAGVNGFAPTIAATHEPIEIAIRAQDMYYNRAQGPYPGWQLMDGDRTIAEVPAGNAPIVTVDTSFDEPGVKQLSVRSADGTITGDVNPILVEDEPSRRIYWGDTHGHSGFAEGVGTPDRFMQWARDDARLDYVTHSEHDIWTDDFEWNVLKENVIRYSREHDFIAFLGYEWTISNFQGGHHNVLFRTPLQRKRIGAQSFGYLSALYQGLRTHHDPRDVVVIPHAHQAGDYRQNDPELEPLIEIMSQHGTFEWFGRMYLNHGHQVGFTAASDNHLSQPGYTAPLGGSLSQRGGLGALRAPEKTTDALFDAMKSLATYATTGERMILDVTVNRAEMGTRTTFDETRLIDGRVIGTAPIDEIVVVKNDEIVWQQHYLSADDTRVPKSGRFLLTFASESEPVHRGDNPRGWRWWRGTMRIAGADVVGLTPTNFHNANTQNLEKIDDETWRFATYTRGSRSSIALDLTDIARDATIELDLEEGREFGGAPPIFRAPQNVPAASVSLDFRNFVKGELTRALPFGTYVDTVSLRHTIEAGPRDVSFSFNDSGVSQGDFYFVRVTQANDAQAWSSPVWIGGYPKR